MSINVEYKICVYICLIEIYASVTDAEISHPNWFLSDVWLLLSFSFWSGPFQKSSLDERSPWPRILASNDLVLFVFIANITYVRRAHRHPYLDCQIFVFKKMIQDADFLARLKTRIVRKCRIQVFKWSTPVTQRRALKPFTKPWKFWAIMSVTRKRTSTGKRLTSDNQVKASVIGESGMKFLLEPLRKVEKRWENCMLQTISLVTLPFAILQLVPTGKFCLTSSPTPKSFW